MWACVCVNLWLCESVVCVGCTTGIWCTRISDLLDLKLKKKKKKIKNQGITLSLLLLLLPPNNREIFKCTEDESDHHLNEKSINLRQICIQRKDYNFSTQTIHSLKRDIVFPEWYGMVHSRNSNVHYIHVYIQPCIHSYMAITTKPIPRVFTCQ